MECERTMADDFCTLLFLLVHSAEEKRETIVTGVIKWNNKWDASKKRSQQVEKTISQRDDKSNLELLFQSVLSSFLYGSEWNPAELSMTGRMADRRHHPACRRSRKTKKDDDGWTKPSELRAVVER